MKILHINSYYLEGHFYKNLYERQKSKDLSIQVYVPTTFDSEDKDFKYGSYTTISKNHSNFDRKLFFPKHKKIYADIIKRYQIGEYDLIHAHSLFSNGYIAYMLYKNFKIPYIVAVRNTDVNIFFKRIFFLRRLGNKILLNATKVVFISNTYKEETIEKYILDNIKKAISDKSVVIPNGVGDFWLDNIAKSKDISKDKTLRLLYVGDVNENKNIETTIAACQLLIDDGYDIDYTIVGKIKSEKYHDLINQHKFINYIPYTPKEALLKIYKSNDIFVMPSENETFGLVYVEAMSQGLPLIYTKGQGFDSYFEDGQIGYAVQFDSANDIFKSIKAIRSNYQELSTNAVRLVNRFNWDKVSRLYNDLYKSI